MDRNEEEIKAYSRRPRFFPMGVGAWVDGEKLRRKVQESIAA